MRKKHKSFPRPDLHRIPDPRARPPGLRLQVQEVLDTLPADEAAVAREVMTGASWRAAGEAHGVPEHRVRALREYLREALQDLEP